MKKELREERGGFESLGSVWIAAKPEGRVRTLCKACGRWGRMGRSGRKVGKG